jgi:hypothetical protein
VRQVAEQPKCESQHSSSVGFWLRLNPTYGLTKMTVLKQYGIVRVVRLLQTAEEHDGWRVNKRSPQIGDTGTIVEILHTPNLPDKYVVEAVEPDGNTIWLGDFDASEIEPAP